MNQDKQDIDILPAIIPDSFSDLQSKMEVVLRAVPMIHIDVMDGTMTKETSWPYNNSDHKFEEIQKEEIGMPYWEELVFEAHLMTSDPALQVAEWVTAGAERVIVHVEAFPDPEDLHLFIKDFRESLSATPFLATELGLAIDLNTPLEAVLPFVLDTDFIHLMSIASIGRQGNKFEEKIFDRIKELKGAFPEAVISVDGGVNAENASALRSAGVNRLVVGSAIFDAEYADEALEDLLKN